MQVPEKIDVRLVPPAEAVAVHLVGQVDEVYGEGIDVIDVLADDLVT